MIKRFLAVTTVVAAVLLVAGAGTAQAASVPIENAGSGATFNSTSELGTGAMTSNASVTAQGTVNEEHPGSFERDNFGRVGGGLAVEGGSTYEITVTLEGAAADESASAGGTARGFVSADVYDCCFAGEARFLTGGEAELPSSPGEVEVTLEVYVAQDTNLNVDVKLHSFVSVFTDTQDTASVEASNDTTLIDVSPVGEPAPEPEPPSEEEPRGNCFLFFCF